MSRLALVADLRLVFDPLLSDTTLTNDAFYGTSGDDTDAVDSVLQNAQSSFEQRVPQDFRLNKRTNYERHAVETEGHEAYKAHFSGVRTDYTPRPAQVKLDHAPVLPIDSAEGDAVEIRKAMNDWTDVTANSDDEYDLVNASDGILLVDFAQVVQDQGIRHRITSDRRWVRVKYRYGATGGDVRVGGQTTITDSITSNNSPDFTVGVNDTSRLPPAPFIALILDESDPQGSGEYVRVTGVDAGNSEVTIGSRGERTTPNDQSHSSGDVIHYAPLFVRDAVAKKAAIQLTQNEDYSEWLPDTDIPLDAPRKIDEWRNDYQDAVELLS